MELRYLIAHWNKKRLLFILTHEEENTLRERMRSQVDCPRVFISGFFRENDTTCLKLARWKSRIDSWIITSQTVQSEAIGEAICQAHIDGVEITSLDSFILKIDPCVPAHSNQVIKLISTQRVHRSFSLKAYSAVRNTLEPIAAGILFVLISPILFAVALMVKLTSPGPVIYSQERVGYRGKVFKIYKFRSMRTDAEKNGVAWSSTQKNDPKLTPIGGFLRASHLDELPQLWNVVRGEVSFIGPRPERPEFVKQLTDSFPLFKLRPLVKPGITGWAQVKQGYANSFSDSRKKLEFDLFYMMRHSPVLDFEILLRTVKVLFSGGTEEIKRAQVVPSLPNRFVKKITEEEKQLKAS